MATKQEAEMHPNAKLEKWRVSSRRSSHTKLTTLFLYPELDCSACVDDVYEESGEGQLAYYVDYIQRNYTAWWEADAVVPPQSRRHPRRPPQTTKWGPFLPLYARAKPNFFSHAFGSAVFRD